MARITLLCFLLFALIGAGCSKPAQAPKQNTPANMAAPAPAKKSYRADYDRDMPLAFKAHDAWEGSKSDADYIDWTVKMHAALKWVNLHRKENGDGSVGSWPRLQELKELRSGYWKNAKGPMNDPAVKAAIDDWGKSGN